MERRKALVVFIQRVLPDGDIFGSANSDEFLIELAGEMQGVFKRFEYLSLPFSVTGNREKFDELVQRAGRNGTSFRDELAKDPAAGKIVEAVFKRMESSPAFSRQVLDTLLGRVYVDDNVLSEIEPGNTFEDHLAKVVTVWKHLSDFYCVEGLVGGGGERNPFRTEEKSSFVAGALDSLETVLPVLRQKVTDREWKKICLKLSSVVGRDYKQVDRAVDVLGIVFGNKREMPDDEIQHALALVGELAASAVETNTEIGKFCNTVIRFHNWLPLALKQGGPSGDTYDSICIPAKKAMGLLEETSEIAQALLGITDATSPKGLALAALVDNEKVGNKSSLIRKAKDLEDSLLETVSEGRKKFFTFELGDSAFYSGLVGGKWKGLKLLYDAKAALGLTYMVPRGFVISAIGLEEFFREEGIDKTLGGNIFSVDERLKILGELDRANFESCIAPAMVTPLGDSVIVRSSMYGEDGHSNFSGTYESVPCKKDGIAEAIREVVKSYFSQEAIKSREDVGLAHIPGISLIVQEMIKGNGGVIHLTQEGCSVSFAETPEDAVLGNGNCKSSGSIEGVVKGTPVEPFAGDLETLYDVFGDLDMEFVIDAKADMYLIQLRPKCKMPKRISREVDVDRRVVTCIDDLSKTSLDRKCVVAMDFLGNENVMNREAEIMEFIRRNRPYIAAVEGNMPCVAHIPNKIEGHFRIPYFMAGGAKSDK